MNPFIIEDLCQGTEEWFAARKGIPTASCFHRIITPGKLIESAQATTYAIELVAEKYEQLDQYSNQHMTNGIDREQCAREAYQFITGNDLKEVGIVYSDESKSVGCSPDGLIGKEGGLEIKCPKLTTHINYILSGVLPNQYRLQVQGALWVTGRSWWDFMSYHPSARPFLVRVEVDKNVHEALEKSIPEFIKKVSDIESKVMA